MSLENSCRVDYIKNIDFMTFRPKRSGVIVYTKYKKSTHFISGIDNESGDVTNFAGGVSYKNKNENGLIGGLREFSEESLGIFGYISVDEIKNCLAVYDQNDLIIFIPLNINIALKYTCNY